MNKNSTESEIADLIELYRQGFLQLKPDLLLSVWDHSHHPLIYVAMEKTEPIHGWPAIRDYIAALPEHIEEMVEKKIDDIKVDPIGDTAVAFYQFQSTVRLKGREELYKPCGRVTMLFRRMPNGWRVIHYHESALSAQSAKAIATRAAG